MSKLVISIFAFFLVGVCLAESETVSKINVVPQICEEAKQAMDSSCETKCAQKSWKSECVLMCSCSKKFILSNCETMNWSNLKSDIFTNVCPFLAKNRYVGSFLRFCKNDELKRTFCTEVAAAFDDDTACVGDCKRAKRRMKFGCAELPWQSLQNSLVKACPLLLEHRSAGGPFRAFCKIYGD